MSIVIINLIRIKILTISKVVLDTFSSMKKMIRGKMTNIILIKLGNTDNPRLAPLTLWRDWRG